MYNEGTFTATDCEFSENTAGREGGVVYNKGTFTATDCEFSENTAVSRAAAFVVVSLSPWLVLLVSGVKSLTLSSSLRAFSQGGAVYNGGTFTATDCAFSENSAVSRAAAFVVVGFSPWLVLLVLGVKSLTLSSSLRAFVCA